MNVYELTNEPGNHHIWEYALLSATLMALTFAITFVWSIATKGRSRILRDLPWTRWYP